MADQPRESNGKFFEGYEPARYFKTEAPENGGPYAPTTGIGPGRDLTVDVSDALTGLKALRREADAAVRSLKALDEALGNVNLRHTEETEIFRPEVSE
ncbi:hypothetical protein KM924_23170 [Brevibacillus parabrevis]|uniref:hypothetical protein n=1 Tax=Brevibacillus parabrevis TaxID=54914 RepID=UPI001C237D34|nr:hypothetical protein [Brevibacillus parabrevis]MBU8715407.1 hypothetical protein [Brevibacillus parabrevis]